MTTGRINQVARPPATPRARPPAVPGQRVGRSATRRRSFERRAGRSGGCAEGVGDPRRASPPRQPTRDESGRGAQSPGLNRFHRIRIARDRPEGRPARREQRRGTHGAPQPVGSPPPRREGRADVRSSGREVAAFRLRSTDRTEGALQAVESRGTNETRDAPAVGCTGQGNPRTQRAEHHSRAVACRRRTGIAPSGARRASGPEGTRRRRTREVGR